MAEDAPEPQAPYSGKMSDEQIASAFSVAADSPQMMAWFQLLDESIEYATEEIEDTKYLNHHGALAGLVGQMASLRGFRKLVKARIEDSASVLSGENPENITRSY